MVLSATNLANDAHDVAHTATQATQYIMDDLQLLGDTIGYIDLLLL